MEQSLILEPKAWRSTLTPYRSSAAYTRHFCTTCGTHMVFEHVDSGNLHIATGTIDATTSDEIVSFKGHMWIQFSGDGGASDLIPSISGKAAERWTFVPGESEQVPRDWRAHASALEDEAAMEFMPLHCHCNRVQLRIKRPTEASKSVPPANQPPDWPDLIVPAHAGRPNWNKDGVPWWLSQDSKRFLAGVCTCTSCRLGTGFDIMSWTFVPIHDIQFKDGEVIHGSLEGLEANKTIDTMLSIYKSKSVEGIKRYFCPTCGASVFWFSPERPYLLDVATGLLDAPSGVRAETFLEWRTNRVSYQEEALHKGLIEGLAQGMKQWKQEENVQAS